MVRGGADPLCDARRAMACSTDRPATYSYRASMPRNAVLWFMRHAAPADQVRHCASLSLPARKLACTTRLPALSMAIDLTWGSMQTAVLCDGTLRVPVPKCYLTNERTEHTITCTIIFSDPMTLQNGARIHARSQFH